MITVDWVCLFRYKYYFQVNFISVPLVPQNWSLEGDFQARFILGSLDPVSGVYGVYSNRDFPEPTKWVEGNQRQQQ